MARVTQKEEQKLSMISTLVTLIQTECANITNQKPVMVDELVGQAHPRFPNDTIKAAFKLRESDRYPLYVTRSASHTNTISLVSHDSETGHVKRDVLDLKFGHYDAEAAARSLKELKSTNQIPSAKLFSLASESYREITQQVPVIMPEKRESHMINGAAYNITGRIAHPTDPGKTLIYLLHGKNGYQAGKVGFATSKDPDLFRRMGDVTQGLVNEEHVKNALTQAVKYVLKS